MTKAKVTGAKAASSASKTLTSPAAKGIAVGIDNISIRVKMSDEGTVLNGTFKSDIKTPDGVAFFTTIGTYTAKRIQAER